MIAHVNSVLLIQSLVGCLGAFCKLLCANKVLIVAFGY